VAEGNELARMLEHAGINMQESKWDTVGGPETFGLSPHEVILRFPHEVRKFRRTGQVDDDLYHALYDWYHQKGMMPYGIAKDRDGDSREWIAMQLGHECDIGLEETAQDYAPEMAPASVAVPGPVSDVIVDESTCNMTAEGEYCPEHGLEECGMYEGDYGLTLAPTAESREFDLTRLKQLALGK